MPSPAVLSDWLFTSAVGGYMLAALLSATEYVLARRPASQPAMAGAAPAPATAPTPALAPAPTTALPLGDRLGRVGVSVTVLGALLHLASVVLRGFATARVPWGNMYEYLSAFGLVAVGAWLSVLRRHPVRRIAVFVLLPVALVLFLAGNLLYTEAAAVQPALRSYWIVIHVAAAIMASGVFLVSGVTSGLHLLAEYRADHPGTQPGPKASRLPAPEFLDRLAYRSGVFGFLTVTFAIVTGAIWAESAWGRYWGWDPKETVAFVTWVCYAAYLHARATAGWQRRRAAWLNLAGLVVVLFNLFFVNLVVAGLHSYAGG
ncbi:c-type cytochrome biogenesis protein CcsB [Actinophytocola sp.]|uniref:c-type cytochrome biogenesis protein CcsB n=1 Tax=Actinophytocola sp. TaxID=1872138 RepID=UPI002ED98B4F